MIKQSIWFIVGSIVLVLGAAALFRRDFINSGFSWMLEHPMIPLAGGLALWAIIALLGEKNLKKAIWLEVIALGVLFHVEFKVFFESVLWSLTAYLNRGF